MKIGWFSYIIFLIYLGGLIVLFIYISRLAYNEKFKLNIKEVAPQIFLAILIFIALVYENENSIKKIIKLDVTEVIFKIYRRASIFITSVTILYLIITLIVVVKITSQFNGPLRAKN